MPERPEAEPNEFCITIVCDGLHPDDIEELRRSLAGSGYDFRVDVAQKVRTEDYPELLVIGIHTKLVVRFSAKWFYGQTRRGGVKTVITAIDDVLDRSSHDRDHRPKLSLGSSGEELITFEKWLRPRTKKHSWSRDHKLALGVLILTGVAAVAAWLVVPEFRRLFHLDKSEAAQQVQPEKQATQSVTTPSIATDQPKSLEASQPRNPIPTQKTKTHVTGNDNVAGNNFSGDNSVTGNNNKTAPTANAPNGIAITGGTVTNPTVNNFNSAPPTRRLTDEQKTALVSCLKNNTGSFIVGAVANNGEAYRYALDFSEVFSAAGWKNEWPAPTATFMIGGGMWSGVHLSIAGSWDDKTQRASIAKGSPELTMMNCLNQAKVVGSAIPDKDRHSGSIRIDVSENP